MCLTMYWCVVLLCLLCSGILVDASANSLKDPYICGAPSCIPSDKFKYQPDIVYHYEYKVNVNTWFAGSTNNQSTLDIRTIAQLQFVTACEGLLQLSNVTLVDQDDSYPVERAEKFVQAVSQFELRFAFHEGIISEICPNDTEEDWVLNFKRGVLSLLQNSMKRFDINYKGVERDIHGTCPVDYTVRGQENTSLIIVKSRDLSQCSDRYKYLSILQTVRYNFQSKFQTWPVLNSENKCVITVDHHVYKKVACRERHLFEPFSGKNSGAMTTVVQNLTLVREVNKTDTQIMDSAPKIWSVITTRSNLLNHHSAYGRQSASELKSARDVLKLLCQVKETADDSGPAATVDENLDSGSTVGLWGRLVRACRGLDYPALSQLLTRAPTICDRATKHILDALPYVARAGSVELIKDMIVRDAVNRATRDEWLMSMAMIPRPTIEMVGSMLELLKKQRNDKVISFTVSSMVHSYCKHSGKALRECCEGDIPSQILAVFEEIVIGVYKKGLIKTPREDRNNIVIAIKALGNIGGFQQSFADIIMDIISDSLIPVPIRLTAVDAFRKTPCAETREYFLETFRGDYVDAEVRLAAYLQLMRCPTLSTVRKIFHSLENESVNQVKTFVWSHLNNLGQSSLPSRVEIQGLLSGNTVPQLEDSPDFRMFSRNYEQSVFFDQYNAGGNYEANVIFSPDSYIPRSLSVNLTIDMFGESINLLELKARGEGFERYFESIFGNNGPLNKMKLKDQIRNIRFFRSLTEADEVRAKIDDLNYKNDALRHQFPVAELGVKVFGNEISYWQAEGHDEITKSLARLNPQLRILEILSGKEISYQKASLFLDTTFSVPTGCGLPLNMNLMGTSYVDMKMAGTVVDKFSNTGSLDFEGKIHPSVAVNVAATMGVIAGRLSSTGIRLNMRLYTATAVAVNFSLRGLKMLRLDLSLPHSKQEIFAAKSELITLHGEKEMQQQGLNQNRIERNTCSWSAFDTAIGIKICAAYQFPNMTNLKHAPYFLMSGPSKYIVSLEKADPSANTYSVQYSWQENATADNISFSFNTPNSQEKRIFNAEMFLSKNTSTAKVSFQSAQSTLQAKALYRNMEYDKSLEASLHIDGRKHFDTVMALKRHDIKFGFVWVPHAYWVVDDLKIAELSGTLKVKAKGGVTQWDIAAEFQTKQLASRLQGYYIVNGPTQSTKLQLDYQFFNNPKQTLKLEGLYSERAIGYRHDIYGEVSMESTAYPVYNLYAVLKNVKSHSHQDIGFNVSSSRDLKNDPTFSFSFVRIDRLSGLKIDTSVMLAKPRPVRMQLGFEQIGPKYSALVLLNVNPKSRDIVVSGFLYHPPGTQLYINTELNMTLPALHPMTVKVKVHEKDMNEYQMNAVGVWFTGMDFNVDALYQDHSKTNLASHNLKAVINSNHFKDIAFDARFTQDSRQITFHLQGEYDEEKYRALIRYVLLSEQNFTAYAELDVNNKVYSMSLNADLNNNTNINVDVHLDQLRDVHISYQRWLTAKQKRLSAAVNWDANRDPSQKVSVDVQLDQKGPWHHAAQATLFYPGRVLNGEMEFLLKDWYCEWLVQLGWSQKDVVVWKAKLFSEAKNETVYALLSSMDTPFAGWRDTSFNLMWRYHDNLQAINGSMHWQDDYLAFGLLADYLFKTNEFFGELNAVVNSTIPTLPRAAASAKHRVIWKKCADTLLSFQYNEEGKLMINSSWQIDKGAKENNVTGKVTIITPFKGYRKGFLRTNFVLGHKKDIYGVTYLDLNDKVMKIFVNGYMHRITNSMLVINVTSPVTELSHISARFGFVEHERRLVAMVVTPNSTTGIEVLVKLMSTQDFHIFGHVALPIQYLNRAMLTAKRAKEELDFRVGWGDMDLGFTGIWHYQSSVNFVYLYKLYTPLEGFEENGFVLKNIYGKGLDTEVSIRLSKHKFGIAVLLYDHGKGLVEAVQTRLCTKSNNDQLIEDFDTTAQVILDTLYYPTITFDSHMMKFMGANEEDIVQVNATLNLPNKPPIVLTDVFVLEEYTVMHNTLNVVTPFQAVKELQSVYTVNITFGEQFNVTCKVLLYDGTYWNEMSYRVNYEYYTGEDEAYKSHQASLGLVTPLAVLPSLESAVSVRLEGVLWKMAADIGMPSFNINAVGRLELDDPFIETSGSLNLTSSYLENYFIKMDFKKDISDSENVIGGGIQITQGAQDNYVSADVTWRPSPAYMRFKSKAALYPVLPPSDIVVAYEDDPSEREKSLQADLNFGKESIYSLRTDKRSESISVTLSSPHKGFRAVKVIGEFDKDDIRGSFVTDAAEYSISGKVLNREPLEMSLVLVPKGQGEPVTVRAKCEFSRTVYGVSAHFGGAVNLTLHARAQMEANFTDINIKMDLPQSETKDLFFKARLDSHPDLRKVVSVQAVTPFKRLQHIKGDTDFVLGPKTGYVLLNYEMPDMKGDGDLKWSFDPENMYMKALGHQNVQETLRSMDLDIYFGRSLDDGLQITDAGFKMDLNKVWQIGVNATFGFVLSKRLLLKINAVLPKPNVDMHSFYIKGLYSSEQNTLMDILALYSTDVTKIQTGLKGKLIKFVDTAQANATVLWTSNGVVRTVDNAVFYGWDVNGSKSVDYALVTPLYVGQETFKVKGSYQQDMVHEYKVVKGLMHCPGHNQIGEIDLRYGGVRHTDGHFNVSTPFDNLAWLKSIFDINNGDEHSNNKIKLFWPNHTASLNSTDQYTKQGEGFTQGGQLLLSLPLSVQHHVVTDYYYIHGEKASRGNATVDLDGERFVKGFFKQVRGKSQRNLDLATTDIEVENQHTPVGIRYIHESDATGVNDVKQATVFHLHNATKFNVTGKFDVYTFDTGKNIKLTAIHGNRTLTFHNEYEALDQELKQGSKIKWAEDTWINYNIHVTNMTTAETESQQLIMNLRWPLRSFNLVAVYRLQDAALDGNARLGWDVKGENKTAELRARWDNPPAADGTTHNVALALAHPSFKKDVSLKGHYISTPAVMSNISIELQYSDYENEYLRLKSILTDNSNGPIRDYKFGLTCSHPATNLDLEMRSDINIHSKWYYFDNYYRFQKTLFFQKLRQHSMSLDLQNSTVKYERANETFYYRMNGTWQLAYPEYRLRSLAERAGGADSALAVLSMRDKSLVAHFNSTDDVSYHLVGMIADTRSAQLNAWRDFDDVTTVDLASYIRLNHSRLLTSSVVWRPQIFAEVKAQAVGTLKHVYSQINETLIILKEAPMEAHSALRNIWGDARIRIRDFLDDLNDLHVIKDDLDEFERFLNGSYEANDFYVKDIVELTTYVLDEMSLKGHLKSLPGIVTDMWGMMGNTSQSIKQSLTYVVDTIKKAYANFLEAMNKVVEADLMDLVSQQLESAILQYDNFIRDLHMKLLEYWEATWVNASTRFSKYWHELLKSMEPLFFKIVHYTESFVFTIWRGVMDFFYNRTQELTDSPYFNYVSTFGHEMDRIYKDLISNDLLTNIRKYSRKLWNVLWGKVEQYIPFKDEFTQLYAEFKSAFEHFFGTPQVLYVREKYIEAFTSLRWWYDYFMIGEALDRIWEILYNKVTDLAKTALQYEEQHRSPKTNFVFDPRQGEIRLEQKLPMSWHAFNRTPDFTEIAEYKVVSDFLKQWLMTNKSIRSYYYDVLPYLDSNNVLPPFGGMAIMTGHGTLVTFDKRIFTISEPGTFVLSKDYRQNNFTVLMESNPEGRYNLVVLTRRNLIHVDLYKEQVSIGKNVALTLPNIVDNYIIDRELDTISVQSANGLQIQCNLLFHTCKLQVTGWYYASLGGLLGTYNNEQYDEMQLPNNSFTDSVSHLAHSWNIEQGVALNPVENHESKNDTQCEKFFLNKVSPLHPCFSAINATPYYAECMAGVEACTLASTYLELCSQQLIPIHVPEQCVQCTTPQGDIIEEGSFHVLQYVPNSTDVVFVLEAQYCNKDLRKAKNIDLLVEAFDSKLQESGLADNRYAIVGYGGHGVYKKPRSLYVNNKVFTNAIEITQHFDHFVIEKRDQVRGNRTSRPDVFAALSFAATLPYRAGVPRTVLLLPCGRCDIAVMRLDYSAIYHSLIENSLTLHILMDDEFVLAKKRASKNLFGVDSVAAYTNKDYENLVGDPALRKQVKLPKEKLGMCTSLAMETNGTIFAGRKLSQERPTARRFATVLGGRVAASARRCQARPRCECRDARLHCRPCADTQRLLELSFWNTEDIDELIDLAIDPPSMPILD